MESTDLRARTFGRSQRQQPEGRARVFPQIIPGFAPEGQHVYSPQRLHPLRLRAEERTQRGSRVLSLCSLLRTKQVMQRFESCKHFTPLE